ncbi:maltose alpha-D-glucosyltransferase [Ideonella azotifigens]|uniref:maltose alpha-D-glucosyltransferase n=3 Tax=Ideonella azotifigens TaxID=513160 RepID=A0ABN1KKS6_9BURK|nr:maltose alpha-D-glucosyltransferase [Ideonella azotifigens]MCD2339278.1 maltose alpha-D-glucosyltransferase [Ideonella azotifigens]
MNAPLTPKLDTPDLQQTAQPALVPAGTATLDAGAITPVPTDPALWYKDAVVYQLNVKAFVDSNEDGVGDFLGLASRLDYVKELGVNTLWLMPFYPSPLRDDGYDIAYYTDVHPQYGTLDDFKLMLAEAHKRDLKVITELVINHTSDQHPWFQAARRAPPGSPEREFYVWSETNQKYLGTRIIFTDTETSNWTWDPVAGAYFWHRFFSHQPDLNFDNPAVLEAILKIMRFWLDLGVDGFRLDAIPYLVEREGSASENLPETHAIIKQLRAAIDRDYPGRFLLAEANQWPEDVREYFGDGDECHAAYHFPLMPRMYMAIAQEDRFPVVEIMQQTPDIPDSCQWAIFLRNHDELTLEMVTSKERDYMYSTYAADPRARINVGIRRRLAPLLDNDQERIKLMNSLLLSMRGSPIIYYGDELGMGDNVYVGDRNGVRTPMQWSPDRNAGFSRADPQRLYLPPIMDAIYGYQAVNVESQTRDPSSLLNWMRRLLSVRQSTRAFGRGELVFLTPGNRKVLAYLREYEGETILCVANLARSAQPVELDLAKYRGRVLVEMIGRTPFPPVSDLPYLLTLPAYGFFWFRLAENAPVPAWHTTPLSDDRPLLVMFDGWRSLFPEQVLPSRTGLAQKIRARLENDTLPRYIEGQRWYAAHGEAIASAKLAERCVWAPGPADGVAALVARGERWLLPLVTVESAAQPATAAEPPRYFVPLSLAWEDGGDEDRWRQLSPAAIARVRQQGRVGVMADAYADEGFCRAVVAAMGAGLDAAGEVGEFRFRATRAFAELGGEEVGSLAVTRVKAQTSNTIVTLGDRLFLKGYRRARAGQNPEVEMGRFLTEVAQFPNCVPLAGTLEHVDSEGRCTTLACLQAYVVNQGDGWAYSTHYLQRYLELCMASGEPPQGHAGYLALIRTLGQRTAELHQALAKPTGDPAFDPEPLTATDLQAHVQRLAAEGEAVLDKLQARQGELTGACGNEVAGVLALREHLLERLTAHATQPPAAWKTRYHGDYHLAQVLLTKDDFVITDLEGEPGRSVDERRAKDSPLRDVAGMLRSFSYARLAALRAAATTSEHMAQLAPLSQQWESEARTAFLAGYDEAARSSTSAGGLALYDHALLPGQGLLGLYELEKAFYELRYELDHRPDWACIPLQGMLGLVEQASAG